MNRSEYGNCRYCGECLGPEIPIAHTCDGSVRAAAERIVGARPSLTIEVKVSARLEKHFRELVELTGEDADVLARLALIQGIRSVARIYLNADDCYRASDFFRNC